MLFTDAILVCDENRVNSTSPDRTASAAQAPGSLSDLGRRGEGKRDRGEIWSSFEEDRGAL